MNALLSSGARPTFERTLVVLPTYNELENLPRLVPRLLALDPVLDILVVDDASPDGTGDIADQLARADPRSRVRHRAGKQGLGTVYLAGFR
jgi:dolichol-phosphate mannosyltransferase